MRLAGRTLVGIFLGWLAIVAPVKADTESLERVEIEPADASLIVEPAAAQPRKSFAARARLARLDARGQDAPDSDPVCGPPAQPLARRQIVAVSRAEPPDDVPAASAPAACGESDAPCSSAADPVERRQAWPRIIGHAPVALSIPQTLQDRLWQNRLLQDRLLQDPASPHQERPDPAPVPAAVTEFDRQSSRVNEYLCGVYWRMPHKIDDAGDFSWKDGVAAALSERTICDYAINGMHPDLREALYVLGHKADAAGINWSLLSGFRDDFRQSIAKGFRAKDCESWHGGSCKTNGWGDGRAADVWIADQDGYPVKDASPLLALVDQMAPALGLTRPMRWADPPHVQMRMESQEVAQTARDQRPRGMSDAANRSTSNR